MTSPAPTSISAFQRGSELPPATFTLDSAAVAAYLRAVGDTGSYGDCAPPLAIVAFALRSLQESVSLPEGSLHTGQEVEHLAPVPVDAPLTFSGRVAQRSERQGFVISVLEYEISIARTAVRGGTTALRARTTIMAPASAA